MAQLIWDGLFVGSFYALIALGYSMVYGITKLLNFAHGDIYMLGAFIGFAILIGLMAWYRIVPGPSIVWLPALMLLALATAAGVGVWLAALNVRYRDVRYVVPFVVQLWMFATPVAYPASLVPAQWRAVYGLNPMAGVIEGFRWALAGGPAPGVITLVSAAVVVVLIAGGAHYFRRLEGTFADVI